MAAYDPQYAAAVQAFIQDQNGRLDQVVYQSRYQQAKAEMEQAKSVVDQAISFNDEVGAEGAKRNLLAAKDRHNAVISMSYEGQQYLREIDQFLVGAQTRIENIKKINRIKGSIANDMELMRQGIDAGDDTRAGTHRRNVVESLEDLRRLSQDPAMGTFIEGQYVALDELDRRLQKIVLENKIRALKADITAQKDTLSRAVNCGNEEDANFVRMQIQSAVETLSNLLASDDDVADDVTFISEVCIFAFFFLFFVPDCGFDSNFLNYTLARHITRTHARTHARTQSTRSDLVLCGGRNAAAPPDHRGGDL